MRIGLVGNPNVGKSTIFNALTGLHQHTGNWTGKTVDTTSGYKTGCDAVYEFIDLPGTYSLMAHSKEEEVTRDFIYFDDYDALLIVCDAVSLERNLNLVLNILEVTDKVVICVNLVDEAKKKGIEIKYKELSHLLNVTVLPVVAKNKEGLDKITEALDSVCENSRVTYKPRYNHTIESAIRMLDDYTSSRAEALKLISDKNFARNYGNDEKLASKLDKIRRYLCDSGVEEINTSISTTIQNISKDIAGKVVVFHKENYNKRDIFIDRILTSRVFGYPLMILLLIFIFYLTIKGANYPSDLLYGLFFTLDDYLIDFFNFIHMPYLVTDVLVNGVYRTMAWVVAVMLPPMLIFFPLFTLLEDLGYLPRVAFNLDNVFSKCGSCGKQALTMSMGFGCNAVAVTGARIIDSKRERILSIITNSFIPCNGRFPILITIISLFIVTSANSFVSSLVLTGLIIFSILFTFLITKILSLTILKGEKSSFTLELPPYRMPKIGSVIIHSVITRALFILKRAVYISASAGLIIWFMANVKIDGDSLLLVTSNFLDPAAALIGLDGVIVLAFILGLPANEIVIPLIIVGYMGAGQLIEPSSLGNLKSLFIDNGWTFTTAICMLVFTIIHFPCMTTIVTIFKETKSLKYTFLSIFIPLGCAIILCFIINLIL